jgi:hypothetical protein
MKLCCDRHIWVHEGPRGLFRGLGPNLVGVAPSRAIYFWSYSTTKKGLNCRLPKPNRDTPFVHVVSAASAGTHFLPHADFYQCCGSMKFWYGSGSADPYL